MNFSFPDLIIFCGSTLLLAMLLNEMLDWSCIVAALENSFEGGFPVRGLGGDGEGAPGGISPGTPGAFVYGERNGPSTWRTCFPEARGREQSPVNISLRCATVLMPSEPLRWRGYSREPISMSLANDGNTVVLFGYWVSSSQPSLQGGPLASCYDFHSACFRWGLSDDEGSEHSLDYVRYPLELQVVHLKRGISTPQDAANLKVRDGLVIVSYFFQVTHGDNPYLDHVITNLWRISSPGSCIAVPVFPLEWLFPSFEKKYYSYSGSLTHPPCSEIVTWIIQPEPIAISFNQLAEFHKIYSTDGPILSNTRPVQHLNDRDVFYYG